MNEPIVITVATQSGRGKSTLSQLIAETLIAAGIPCYLAPDPDGCRPSTPDELAAKLESIGARLKYDGTSVLICQQQMRRRPPSPFIDKLIMS